MNRTLQRWMAGFGAAVLCVAGIACVQEVSDGPGTGSETTNGFTAQVRYQDGTPAVNASVKLRTSDYMKEPMGLSKQSAFSLADTQTDSSGRFSLLDLNADDYCIEVLDMRKTEGVLISGRALLDTVVDYGIVYLDPVGSITGTIDTAGLPANTPLYVQITGLDRIVQIDAASGEFSVEGVAAGSYTVRLLPGGPAYLPKAICNVVVSPSAATTIDTVVLTPLSDWRFRRKVWLNTTENGADVAVTITKFPALVRLDSSNFAFTEARPDGGDLRFTRADNTPLPYHFERWAPQERRAEIWVKLDSVYGNSDAHYFTMMWGNPGAAGEENREAVFDTSMGFQGVWHMNETDSTMIGDATANNYDGRKYAMGTASSVPGMCGTAQRFDGSSQYIVLSNTASGKLNYSEDAVYSISAWVYAEVLDGDYHSIISKGNQQYGLQLAKDNTWQFFEYRNREGWEAVGAGAAAKEWCHMAAVSTGKGMLLYVNGTLVDSSISVAGVGSNRITTDNLFIGRRTLDTTRYWNGVIDEVRICHWAHSVNWIRLCYMNQKADNRLTEFREPEIQNQPAGR